MTAERLATLAVRAAAVCALVALTLAALELRTFTLAAGADRQRLAGNLAAMAGASVRAANNASSFTNDQRRLLDVTTARAATMMQRTDVNLNGGALCVEHGRKQSCTQVAGLLPTIAAQVTMNGQATADLLAAARSTVQGLDPVERQLAELLRTGNLTVQDLDALVKDPAWKTSLAALAGGLEAFRGAGVDVEGILSELRHPKSPSRFLRALSFALALLRTGGQARPLFP